MQLLTQQTAPVPLSLGINPKTGIDKAQVDEKNRYRDRTYVHSTAEWAFIILGFSGILVARGVFEFQAANLWADYDDLMAHDQTAVAKALLKIGSNKIKHLFKISYVASLCGAVASICPTIYLNHMREPRSSNLLIRLSRVATIALGVGAIVTGGIAIGAGGAAAGTIVVTVGALGAASGISSPTKLKSVIAKVSQCVSSVFSRLCGC